MKNIEYYQKKLKIYSIARWSLIGFGLALFLIEFTLSLNGIDLFTVLGYIGVIIGIIAIIIGFAFGRIIIKTLEHIEKLKTITEAIEDSKGNEIDINKYESKKLITDNENFFYNIIENNFGNKYKVQTQIYLGAIVNKKKKFPSEYQNELNKTIDFGIFDKGTLYPLLLIEINDKTHSETKRIERDKKVKKICELANLKLISFPAYEKDENYIIEKIERELKI